MKVNIGVLKNELSKYLHKVREGIEVTITDRNEPIAKISPLERPLIRKHLGQWLKRNPPIKTAKEQPSSVREVRAIRTEE